MKPQAKNGFRRDQTEVGRLVLDGELVAGVVLRETAIRLRVPASAGTRLQVGDQLFQFDAASAHLNPDEDRARRRTDEQVEALSRGVVLDPAGLEADLPR